MISGIKRKLKTKPFIQDANKVATSSELLKSRFYFISFNLTNTKSLILARLHSITVGQIEQTPRDLEWGTSFHNGLPKLEKINSSLSTYCPTLRGVLKINEHNSILDETLGPHKPMGAQINIKEL